MKDYISCKHCKFYEPNVDFQIDSSNEVCKLSKGENDYCDYWIWKIEWNGIQS